MQQTADSMHSSESPALDSPVDAVNSASSAASKLMRVVFPSGMRPEVPLYKHQVVGALRMIIRAQSHGYFANFDACGAGKTLQAIYAARELVESGLAEKIIIVCKSHLAEGWKDEFAAHYPGAVVQSVCGEAVKDRGFKKRSTAYITSYELLSKSASKKRGAAVLFNPVSGARLYLNTDAASLYATLRAYRCVLILDESQYIKNKDAKCTRVLCSVSQYARFRYILTATWLAETPIDAWSQLLFLDGGALLGKSYNNYVAQYAITKQICIKRGRKALYIKKITGYKNLGELAKKLRTVSVRRLLSDCTDMPPKVVRPRILYPSNRELMLYRRMASDMLDTVQAIGSNTITLRTGTPLAKQLQDFQVAAAIPWLIDARVNVSTKLQALKEAFIADPGKIVVWCYHRDVALCVSKYLNAAGVVTECVLGGISRKQRVEKIARFKSTQANSARCLVATLASMREGHNLQIAAHAIYMQPDWSLLTFNQSVDRIYRITQTKSTLVEKYQLAGTLDGMIYDHVSQKADIEKHVYANVDTDAGIKLNKKSLIQILKAML